MDDATTVTLVDLDDDALAKAHARLDALPSRSAATITAHHLITHELTRRGIHHGHGDGDPWTTITVEVSKERAIPVDSIIEGMPDLVAEQVREEVGDGPADVTTLMTVNGYAKRIDPVAKASHTPPDDVRAAARQALEWIADGRAGDGFTSVGRGRAQQLASGDPVSDDVLVKMRAYFARHGVDKQADDWGDKSNPTPGMVAWYAWGGDPGRAWANSILDAVDKADVRPTDPPQVTGLLDQYMADEQEEGDTAEGLVDLLDELLAATFAVYLQAHGYHWNVTGPDFTQYHALFGSIAEDTYSSIDPIAENVRKLGGFPSWQMSDMLVNSEMPETDVSEGTAEALVPELLASTIVLLEELMESFDAATAENQQGIANFLAERIDAHQKWAWQLRASLPDEEWDRLDAEEERRILDSLTEEDKQHLAMLADALDRGEDPEPHVPVSMLMAKMVKRGNPDALRRYWREDPKGKVGWGGGGDFTRCVAAVSKYMDPQQAKGFCAIRHREANGFWPGDKRNRTHKAVEPMLKHPGHPNQKVHAGGVIHDTGTGSGMSRHELRGVAGSLSRKGASLSYNDGYDEAQRHREEGADMAPMVQNRRASLTSARAGYAAASGRDERQSHADNLLNSAGYLDGAAGKKRAIRRTMLGYNPLNYATALKAEQEPVLKHPGHPDQKVHGRRGGGGYSAAELKAIQSKPDTVTFKGTEIRKGRDSLWDHTVVGADGEVRLTPQRQALHDKIVAEHLAAGGPSGLEEPTFVMMGGGGGSGKGTLLESGKVDTLPKDGHVHIDPDEIKTQLPEYGAMVNAGRKSDVAGVTHEESSMLAKRVQTAAIANRQNIVLDGTGDSSETKLLGKIQEPRDAGYRVVGEYVTADIGTAWDRNIGRASSGPRGVVPAFALVEAHQSVSRITPSVAPMFDSFRLWDTREGRGKQRVIASTTRGKPLTVRDSAAYGAFRAKATESWDPTEMMASITPDQWSTINSAR